jgi:S-DNA-T family DNA segregation ATPase FtsK/SpoIIIE
MDKELQ